MKTRTITLFDFIEGQSINLSREIAVIEGKSTGPNLVLIGGMHGNEPTGVIALNHVMREIKKLQPLLRGNVFALAGNLTALERGERFISKDLNRVWRPEEVERAARKDFQPEEIINEVEEQIDLWSTIDRIMTEYPGQFYFVDLHTTSVRSVPFALMSDTIMNRQFAKRVPAPVVIGVEEYLSEPLLSYMNELGCVSLAFEGGQHSDPEAVKNHEAMIWVSLVFSGVMKKREVPKYRTHYDWLVYITKGNHNVYDISSRQALQPTDVFQMIPGFVNFQPVEQHQALARLNGEMIFAKEDGLILMPLYQLKGEDGYFIIHKIMKFWLGVSFLLRRLGFYRLLPLLPGVRRFMKSDYTMVVNTNVARWFSLEVLHLMGYRRKKKQGEYTLFIRRKYDFKGPRT